MRRIEDRDRERFSQRPTKSILNHKERKESRVIGTRLFVFLRVLCGLLFLFSPRLRDRFLLFCDSLRFAFIRGQSVFASALISVHLSRLAVGLRQMVCASPCLRVSLENATGSHEALCPARLQRRQARLTIARYAARAERSETSASAG